MFICRELRGETRWHDRSEMKKRERDLATWEKFLDFFRARIRASDVALHNREVSNKVFRGLVKRDGTKQKWELFRNREEKDKEKTGTTGRELFALQTDDGNK